MRVTDLHETKAGKAIISFELSRPKNEKAAANLEKAIAVMKAAGPDYVSVTFGAGGSTRDGSIELIDKLKNEQGFDVVAYIACVGMAPDELTTTLAAFEKLGVKTVFAIRGDAPTWDESYRPHPEALPHASDLLALIKERYDFCLGAAGYPEGHLEAESKEQDLEVLKLKIQSGADYVVAQYFYDNQTFFDFLDRARAAEVTVPIHAHLLGQADGKPGQNLRRYRHRKAACRARRAPAGRQGRGGALRHRFRHSTVPWPPRTRRRRPPLLHHESWKIGGCRSEDPQR
ncbi:MAG: methylenetetrahydrofolate reductase [Deltaproteobacteria bacterium]|nr:methylenetetrahydrofolate reductase [Deltaproteobacteria bacterium]